MCWLAPDAESCSENGVTAAQGRRLKYASTGRSRSRGPIGFVVIVTLRRALKVKEYTEVAVFKQPCFSALKPVVVTLGRLDITKEGIGVLIRISVIEEAAS